MKVDLKTFKAQNSKKVIAHKQIESNKSDVFELRSEGYSYSHIFLWLNTKGVVVSERTIGRFFERNKDEYEEYLHNQKINNQ